ncbi:hypothetical protein LTR66_012013 [Elasticomyces elasticus]|nr:hypothetical protein LTR66_012013 [Elasticomyces elasticus]
MSSNTAPISPAAFASALPSLPLDSLHAKAAELRNSIAHLKSSNEQMMPFADDGDQDCKDAMFENLCVIGRMQTRVQLLRDEVERRGMRWADAEEEEAAADARVNGSAIVMDGDEGHVNGTVGWQGVGGSGGGSGGGSAPGGRLTDEELARRLRERMGDPDGVDGEEDGVHL